jgi:hypothetical protein
LLKDIAIFEKIFREVPPSIFWETILQLTNFAWLESLGILPLSMYFEVLDISFFLKSLYMTNNSSSDHFNILSFVPFNETNLRAKDHNKLNHHLSSLSSLL